MPIMEKLNVFVMVFLGNILHTKYPHTLDCVWGEEYFRKNKQREFSLQTKLRIIIEVLT